MAEGGATGAPEPPLRIPSTSIGHLTRRSATDPSARAQCNVKVVHNDDEITLQSNTKTLMLVWVPDDASAKDRAVYTSAADALRERLRRINRMLVIYSLDDVDGDILAERLKMSQPSSPALTPH